MRSSLIVATIVARCAIAEAAPTAEDLYDAGQAAYDGGDYTLAIDRWRASYRLSSEPALLFDIAQAQRLAGYCADARSSYRQFVALDPTSERRSTAEALASELAAACGQPPNSPPPREDSSRALRIAGLATGGAGGALVVTGLALGHRAATLGDEVTSACVASCTWAAEASKDAAGRRDAAVGRGLDAIGAAAIVGGAVGYYLGARVPAVTVARPSEGGAVVSWSGAW